MKNRYVNDFNDCIKAYYKTIKNFKHKDKDDEIELLKLAKTDIKYRNIILESNLKFVFSVAKKYKGHGVDMEDLISEGNLGLIKAIEKFDIEKDVKFISYAIFWVKAYMLNLINKVKTKNSNEIVFDEPYEVLEDENKLFNTEIEEHIDTVETHNRIKIQKLMSVLDDRERAILELYFGLNGDDMTLDDIGEMLNISKERVRQCKVNAIRKMREELMLSEFC